MACRDIDVEGGSFGVFALVISSNRIVKLKILSVFLTAWVPSVGTTWSA